MDEILTKGFFFVNKNRGSNGPKKILESRLEAPRKWGLMLSSVLETIGHQAQADRLKRQNSPLFFYKKLVLLKK